MRRTILATAAMLVMSMAVAASAMAHTGQVTLISCDDTDAHLTSFPSGKSNVVPYMNIDGGIFTALPKITIDGPAADVATGWRLPDWNDHKVGFYFQWTADGGGKTPVRYAYVGNCGPFPAGTPGPPGPAGPPGKDGVGYDCTGTAVPTGGTPALCPGTSTNKTTTITKIVRVAPKTCESTRKYAFRVRKTYMGQKVVSAKASYEVPNKGEASIKPKVTHERGRLVVRWSTNKVKFTRGGIVRSVTVIAHLANGKNVRLQWLFRPCMGKNGNLNDPSAAGQGSGGGTSAAIT